VFVIGKDCEGERGWIGSRTHVLPHASHASSLAVAAVQCTSLVTDRTVLIHPRSQARSALYLSSAAPKSQANSLTQQERCEMQAYRTTCK